MNTTREKHLEWCKERALLELEAGSIDNAFASMISDLGKHRETAGHAAIGLGAMLITNGHLLTPEKMREFIEGFN